MELKITTSKSLGYLKVIAINIFAEVFVCNRQLVEYAAAYKDKVTPLVAA